MSGPAARETRPQLCGRGSRRPRTMCSSLALFLLLLLLPHVRPAPMLTTDFDSTVKYLHRYGYLSTPTPSLRELRSALRLFQEVIGVQPSGEVDAATVAATRIPRCAHRDTVRPSGRSKRFALPGISKWDKKHFTGLHELTLKWFVSDYTNDIPKATIRQTIQKAFQLWAKQANDRNLPKVTFHFEEAASKEDSDINILWAEGAHGDQYEFDGVAIEDNILAHTFFPGHPEPLNGDIHFDDAETWVTDPAAATSYDRRFFPYVLAHEIGHALGLQHAKKPEAIMSPFYKSTPLDEIKLDLDDKCAINWNYVGTSKFCLFVWLMSEIVPIHNNTTIQMATSTHLNISPKHRLKSVKRILKQTRIPRCLTSNDVQLSIEAKLQKFLHFPHTESKTYSEVLCNFLLGLHAYRGSPEYVASDSFEKEFHGVMKEVSEFGPASTSSVRRMARRAWRRLERGKPSVLDSSYFDERFFDEFLPQYLRLQ